MGWLGYLTVTIIVHFLYIVNTGYLALVAQKKTPDISQGSSPNPLLETPQTLARLQYQSPTQE